MSDISARGGGWETSIGRLFAMASNVRDKPLVWLHSDAVTDCDCGERSRIVQTADGWMWSTHEGPGNFETMQAAMDYAASLHPGHPDVTRLLWPTGPAGRTS